MKHWLLRGKDKQTKKTGKVPKNDGEAKFLIAGLGNPGAKYDNTRHNIGFAVVEELSKRNDIKLKKLKFQSLYAPLGEMVFLKPQTYMNRSGRAVREAAKFYNIPPERIIIIYDDTALPPGRLRLRQRGSDGGHNGIKDILYHLQTDEFPRIKVGVGSSPHPDYNLADWVLAPIAKNDADLFSQAVSRAADAVECILKDGMETAMNRFNGV